jgi:hypothetical protein
MPIFGRQDIGPLKMSVFYNTMPYILIHRYLGTNVSYNFNACILSIVYKDDAVWGKI